MSKRTALYRHWGADGTLLYVGVSLSATNRTASHAAGSAWFSDVVKITIEWFPSRAIALHAETESIRLEAPKFNRSKVPGVEMPRRPPALTPAQVAEIRAKVTEGKRVNKARLAKTYGVARNTIYEALAGKGAYGG